ncbi:Serine/threonine-protein kinase SRPK [Colletotrichum trifolii]|uniref:non-specific serine/threonine protein kinase n=1 Tax=Colletotrichum trifolii TaxID=5466 RepID=A0A4R8RK65_COLTR|nr:Serine/threonine-protein kinase SRPK [Colletotrichum trifolii]
MERCEDVTASPDGAAPPVYLAIEANDLDWVSKMSEAKGYCHTTTHGSQQETMLQFACRKHGEKHGTDIGMDIVDGLLCDGAEINARNGEGEPPLIVAVKARNKAMTARLLKQGADPNAADSRGADFGVDPNAAAAGTPLIVAALNHNLVTAQKQLSQSRGPSTQRLKHPVDKTVISAAMKSVSAGDAAMKMVMAQLEVLSPEHESGPCCDVCSRDGRVGKLSHSQRTDPAPRQIVRSARSSSPVVEYGYIDDVENLSDYRRGGYHPVEIDNCLRNRYRVVHKLGHGTYSTTWLALDERTSEYVAVKVGTADAESREADILSRITAGTASRKPTADEVSMIPTVLDRFSLVGPNGTHACFATAPASCSLADAREASGSMIFQLNAARSLAAQLTVAVALVHSRGYAHGDLHLKNLLLRPPCSLNKLSVEQLYAGFGAPELIPVTRPAGTPTPPAGVPLHAVPPAWLGKPSTELTPSEAKLLLADFGTAFRPADKARFESYTPLVLRPPEAFFEPTTPLSYASDVWSLGCDEIKAQQVHLQGPLPPGWWDRWEKRPKWFDAAGNALSNECDVWTWDRRFDEWVQKPRQSYGMDVVGEEEKRCAVGYVALDAGLETRGASECKGGAGHILDDWLGFTRVR